MHERIFFKGGRCRQSLFLIGILMASQIVSGCSLLPKEQEFKTTPLVQEYEGATYVKVNVQKGDLADKKVINCDFLQADKQDMTFDEEGNEIDKVYVKVGQNVKKGDVLVTTKNDGLKDEMESIKLQIKKLNLSIEQEKALMDLEIEKQKKDSNDKAQIDSIRKMHEATISSNKGTLKITKLQLKEKEESKTDESLVAPMDGKISYVAEGLEGGETDTENVVVTVAGNRKSKFTAKTEYADKFVDGQKVTITVRNDDYSAVVEHPKNKKGAVNFILTDVGTNIKSTDAGTVNYVAQEVKDVLYLPKTAVHTEGQSYFVYYQDNNGLKATKNVEVGLSTDTFTEVKSGVQAGEAIIMN